MSKIKTFVTKYPQVLRHRGVHATRLFVLCLMALIPSTEGFSVGEVSIAQAPAGLSLGDQFRYTFTTSTTRDATSSNINDYNAFVQTAADGSMLLDGLNLQSADGVFWKAIASTETVHANVNAPVGIFDSVYRLDNVLVSSLFFYGRAHAATMTLDEEGMLQENGVWTGSTSSGFANAGPNPRQLGNMLDPGGNHRATIGNPASLIPTTQWAQFFGRPLDELRPFYAISPLLTVVEESPTVVPEPGSYALLAGFLALIAVGTRKKAREGIGGRAQ